jgi:CheY-like chemotaxis protein
MMGRRILVVDDLPDAAAMVALLLGMYGHDCRTAHTGSDALAEAHAFHPDVVLLDIGLPDMSGYEVATELRSWPGPQPFITALTGWGQPEDRERSTRASIDLHVVKPASAVKLKQILEAAERALPSSG